MASNYFLLFKTAQSEFRAWKTLEQQDRDRIIPIIELTRGRKISKAGSDVAEEKWRITPEIYAFDTNVKKVEELFGGCPRVIVDITREDELSCYEIEKLSNSEDGYANWLAFLSERSEHLNDIIPTLLVNPSEDETEAAYKINLERQLDSLMESFNAVAYRASVLIDPDFIYDLILLKDAINTCIDHGKGFYIELDHEFIRPGTGIIHAVRTLGLIKRIREIIPKATIVTLATSFPRVIDEIGDPEHDSFPLEEIFLNEQINKNLGDSPVEYGDYGSINPVRNDLVFASGWRPRIDFPTSKNRTFYYREKRQGEYADHYVSVARKIINDAQYEKLERSWGQRMIEESAHGHPKGKSPSFWISARMEIHIHQQLSRLGIP